MFGKFSRRHFAKLAGVSALGIATAPGEAAAQATAAQRGPASFPKAGCRVCSRLTRPRQGGRRSNATLPKPAARSTRSTSGCHSVTRARRFRSDKRPRRRGAGLGWTPPDWCRSDEMACASACASSSTWAFRSSLCVRPTRRRPGRANFGRWPTRCCRCRPRCRP